MNPQFELPSTSEGSGVEFNYLVGAIMLINNEANGWGRVGARFRAHE
jgi:hypothetical protein